MLSETWLGTEEPSTPESITGHDHRGSKVQIQLEESRKKSTLKIVKSSTLNLKGTKYYPNFILKVPKTTSDCKIYIKQK